MKIHLTWHTETEDIDLGDAYVDVLPPVGVLVVYVAVQLLEPRPVCWRVTTVTIQPAMPGSMTALHVQSGRESQFGIYHVLVEPAEGPFHP